MAKRKIKAKPKKDPIFVIVFFYLALLFLIAATIYTLDLFANGQLSLITANVYSSITVSFLFPVVVFTYMLTKGKTLGQCIDELGLSRKHLTKKALLNGLMLFFAILILEIALSIFSAVTGIQLPTNVQQVLAGTPTYFLVFGILISPFNEEIFFRGFLVPRIGIIPSAIVFTIFHYGYGSVTELAGAFIFGLLAGYMYKKTGSLYSTIFAHFLVNFTTISSLFG